MSIMTILGEKFPPAPLTGFSPKCLAETFGVGENPSGNAYCSGRGLATIGAAMANRGVFKGSKVRTYDSHKVGIRRHRHKHVFSYLHQWFRPFHNCNYYLSAYERRRLVLTSWQNQKRWYLGVGEDMTENILYLLRNISRIPSYITQGGLNVFNDK